MNIDRTPVDPTAARARSRLGIARMFPIVHTRRLVMAGDRGDFAAIDQITDELAAMGLVRPRADHSRFASVAADSRASA